MRIDVFKETTDNWYPSYRCHDMMLVCVSFTQTGPNPPEVGEWRVCVWGGDDMGMEKDFLVEDDATQCFNDVVKLKFVNINILKSMGFISA